MVFFGSMVNIALKDKLRTEQSATDLKTPENLAKKMVNAAVPASEWRKS